MRLGLCCNHPDNGEFTGHLVGVDVRHKNESLIRLYCDEPLTIAYEVVGTRVTGVTIEGLSFPVQGYRSMVGNWCWDEVEVTPQVAARVVEALRGMGATCEEAVSDVFDAYDEGRRITPALLLGETEGGLA